MRPIVQITKPNQIHALRAHLEQLLPDFISTNGVLGITLNGGLSRGYADYLSEIDVTLYLSRDVYEHWQQGNAPFGTGIQMIRGMLYDIKWVDLAQEYAANWSSDALWDASYAQILYDPQQKVRALFDEKLAKRPSPLDASGVMFVAWWHFKLAGDIWIYREDVLQAHLMLNQAIPEIVKAVFFANHEYLPHSKWLIHMSRSLEWLPEDWESRLTQVLCDIAPTLESVQARQQRISALWSEIDGYIVKQHLPEYRLQVMHYSFYHLMQILVEQRRVPIQTWIQNANLNLLNNAPFNLCVQVEDEHVVLDYAKFMALSPDDLYSWHYAIVEAVRTS